MQIASFKVPSRPGGKELALRLRASNMPDCYIIDPEVGKMSYILEKRGGGDLVITRADYQAELQKFISIAWHALALLVVKGTVKEHSDERLVIQPVEVKNEH